MECEVAVVGGGHAGCEAALAAARLGSKTVMFVLNIDKIALMPCNPAIGGLGKGQLVGEVDALGGEMGRNIDATMMQIKVLNRSKGQAVRALRAQADKRCYQDRMRQVVLSQPGLRVIQDEVVSLSGDGRGGFELTTAAGYRLRAKTVVIATGTFLKGKVVVGACQREGGRVGEIASNLLSRSLEQLGLRLGRFQSATPPRVHFASIERSRMRLHPGDLEALGFSSYSAKRDIIEQRCCYITHTSRDTIRVVSENLHVSPIRTGAVRGKGPRYCPSIDRKVINFPERDRHPVFVEPEGWHTEEMYLQGLTTSMPVEIQERIIHTVPGLERAKITRPGYAVAYDYLLSGQLRPTLESVGVENLFTAGQINGTSGYEEAAAQGIIAGINAALKVKGEAPFILKRSQAYIGVLIDDLVNKEHTEPYRMFTSRAEHRLLLRQDNADIRLAPLAHRLGLIDDEKLARVRRKELGIRECLAILKKSDIVVEGSRINAIRYLRRPAISFQHIRDLCAPLRMITGEVAEQVEVVVKYEGYIKKQERWAAKQADLDKVLLSSHLDYTTMKHLSNEARDKLSQIRPASVGQASRIGGVSPADIAVLMVELQSGVSAARD